MSSALTIDIGAVLEHQERLKSLPQVMSDDFSELKARVADAKRIAQDAVDDARGELARLRRQYNDESSCVSEEDIRCAEDYLYACENYANEVFEFAAHARFRMQELEETFALRHASAERELETKIAQYQLVIFSGVRPGMAALPITGATSYARRSVGTGNTTAHAHTGLGGQLPPLPNGLVWVPIEQLDWDKVPDDISFDKAPRESMEAMLLLFSREILPMLGGRREVTRDYLQRLDQRLGNGSGAGSLTFTWECMVGGLEPITLDKPHSLTGRKYGWTYGRHRALLAKAMGWTHVPAKVI